MESDENSSDSSAGMPAFENHRDNFTSIDLTSSFISIKDEPLHFGNDPCADPLAQKSKKNHLENGIDPCADPLAPNPKKNHLENGIDPCADPLVQNYKKNHLQNGSSPFPIRENINTTAESNASLVMNDISNSSENSDDLDNDISEDDDLEEIDSELIVNYIEDPLEDTLLLEDTTFSCSVCSFTTDKKQVLHNHERNHRRTNHPIVECFYCRQRYTRYMLYNHIQNVHPGQKFQIRDDDSSDHEQSNTQMLSCSTCSFSTSEVTELKLHVKDHHSEPVLITESVPTTEPEKDLSGPSFNCASCPFATTDRAEFKTHEEEHNLEPIKTKDVRGLLRYGCRKCSYQCSYLPDMDRHMNTHKKNMEISKCLKCDFRSTSRAMKFHVKRCRRSKLNIEANSELRHDESDNSIRKIPFTNVQPNDKILTNHIENSSDSEKSDIRCNICNFTSVDKQALQNHLDAHDFQPITRLQEGPGRQMYDCKFCSYYTASMFGINNHINLHRQNVPIEKCTKCDYRSTKIALAHHVEKCNRIGKTPAARPSGGELNESVDDISRNSADISSSRLKKVVDDNSQNTSRHLKEAVDDNNQNSADTPCNNLKFKCETCSFSTDNEHMLSVHDKKHMYEPLYNPNSLKKYSCRLCSYWSQQHCVILGHMNSHKRNMPIEKCLKCDFKSTSQALAYHEKKCVGKSRTNQPKNFKCNTCSYSTDNEQQLRVHNKKHMFEPLIKENSDHKYSCRLCSYWSPQYSVIVGHMNSHKKNMPIEKCLNCDFKSTSQALAYHEKKCVGKSRTNQPKNFKCNTCSYSTDNEQHLRVHNKKHMLEPLIKENSDHKFSCRLCSYWSPQYSVILGHLNSHKKNMPIEKCLNCDFKSTSQALAHHEIKCVGKSRTNYPNKIKRNTCSYSTDNEQHLRVHNKKHMFEPLIKKNSAQRYSCRLCSYGTRKKYTMSIHMNSHKKNMPIEQCPHCDFKSTPKALKCHVRKCEEKSQSKNTIEELNQDRSDEAPSETASSQHQVSYLCFTCSFSTSEKEMLQLHIKEHFKEPVKITDASGRAFYQCEMCSYNCQTTEDMDKHLNAHKFNLPIEKCPNCDFKSTPRALMIHEQNCQKTQPANRAKEAAGARNLVTLRTKPKSLFRCTKCPFITCFRAKLNLHIEKRHSTQNLKCPYCSYVCKTPASLKLHKESHGHNKRTPLLQCAKCPFRSTPSVMRKHVATCGVEPEKLPPKKIYACKFCPFTCDSPQTYSVHKKKHIKPKLLSELLRCPKCSYSTFLKSKMALHVKNYHHKNLNKIQSNVGHNSEANQFKCSLCSYVASMPYVISRHFKTHLKKLPIEKCPNCDYRSTYKALIIHSRTCKGQSQSGSSVKRKRVRAINPNRKILPGSTRLYKCDYCPLKATFKQNLKHHMELAHLDQVLDQRTHPVFKCKQCHFVTLYRNKLTKHLEETHHDTLSKKRVRDYLDNPEYAKRLKTTTKEVDATVHVADVATPQKAAVKADDSTSMYECPKCSFSSTHKASLTRHLKLHVRYVIDEQDIDVEKGGAKTSQNPASTSTLSNKSVGNKSGLRQCKLCSYSTRQVSCFKTHMTRHFKNKLTLKQCSYCDYKAGIKVVNRHQKECPKRTLSEVYNCSECSYSSYDANRVKEHERKSHPCEAEEPNSHPKSFKCEFCSFTSFWQYLIEKHMSSHTLLNLPIEQCSKCDFRSTPAALAAHMNSCKKEPHDAIKTPRKRMSSSKNVPHIPKSESNSSIFVSPIATTSRPEFNCPKCAFSTPLRIKLKFHLQKNH